jgi:hypothetical protein
MPHGSAKSVVGQHHRPGGSNQQNSSTQRYNNSAHVGKRGSHGGGVHNQHAQHFDRQAAADIDALLANYSSAVATSAGKN